jgi:hypothetical protein
VLKRTKLAECTIGWAGCVRVAAICASTASLVMAAQAFPPDGCEQQRGLYPKSWSDVSRDADLFECTSHYSGSLRVKLGASDANGRRLMSIVRLRKDEQSVPAESPSSSVWRMWLDREQARRLTRGVYFATIVRKEGSCWIRGDLGDSAIFLLDEPRPAARAAGEGGFYDKAPRTSAFDGDAYACRQVLDRGGRAARKKVSGVWFRAKTVRQ